MLIEFPKINYHLFIPLIYPFFIQIKTFINNNWNDVEDNPFFKLFRYYLSYILSFIFILIIKLRTKIHKKRQSKQLEKSAIKENSKTNWINPLNIQKQIIIKEKRFKNNLFIMFLVLLGFLSNISYIVFNNYFKEKGVDIYVSKQSIGIIFKIIYLIALCKIILKMKIYRHHIFSLYIIFFTSIILFICFAIDFQISITLKTLLYHLLTSFFFCLFDVFGKKYLNMFCDSPYEIMIKIGIISVVLFFLYDIIIYIIIRNDDTDISGIIIGIKKNFKVLSIFLIILDIILFFFWNTGIWLVLYYLTPCHFIISEALSEYLYYFFDFIRNYELYKTRNIIIYGIIYILNIFFFLVYDEIIILNFWDLNKYTKIMIQEREERESVKDEESSGSKRELMDISTNSINNDENNINSYNESIPDSLFGSYN